MKCGYFQNSPLFSLNWTSPMKKFRLQNFQRLKFKNGIICLLFIISNIVPKMVLTWIVQIFAIFQTQAYFVSFRLWTFTQYIFSFWNDISIETEHWDQIGKILQRNSVGQLKMAEKGKINTVRTNICVIQYLYSVKTTVAIYSMLPLDFLHWMLQCSVIHYISHGQIRESGNVNKNCNQNAG